MNDDTKPCAICGVSIIRPVGMYPSAWRKRATCGFACRAVLRERNKRSSAADYVRSKIITDEVTSCWNWTGTIQHTGYGRAFFEGVQHPAHRLSWTAAGKGDVPDGFCLDHLCRNRSCVNPAHLEVVTARENILRGEGLAAQNALKSHCAKGHEFTPENTRHRANGGGRDCLTCRRARGKMQSRLYRARLRALSSQTEDSHVGR